MIHPCDSQTDRQTTELRWLRRARAVAAVVRKKDDIYDSPGGSIN